MRTLRFALALAVLGPPCDSDIASEGVEATSGVFAGHGVVKAVEPRTGWITLDHDVVKGCMPAMEMIYRVQSPDLGRDLHPGDEVDFRIDAAKYVITDVAVVGRGK